MQVQATLTAVPKTRKSRRSPVALIRGSRGRVHLLAIEAVDLQQHRRALEVEELRQLRAFVPTSTGSRRSIPAPYATGQPVRR